VRDCGLFATVFPLPRLFQLFKSLRSLFLCKGWTTTFLFPPLIQHNYTFFVWSGRLLFPACPFSSRNFFSPVVASFFFRAFPFFMAGPATPVLPFGVDSED